MEETITMCEKELDQLQILSKVLDRKLSRVKASQLLKLSERQTGNLLKRLKDQGARGLVSRKRGKKSNHRFPEKFKKRVYMYMKESFEDFGPSFAQEKLSELYAVDVSVETLRQWMIEWRLWTQKTKKRKRHLTRDRRQCFGELIQIDGSHHKWFGKDGPTANLTVFVDDATSQITSLHFSEQETLEGYFEALEGHIRRLGRPRAMYSDRYSIFQTPNKIGKTQFNRALDELGIESILAYSPQAKGRVERANRTLQDRLIKEMKLRGIKTIEEGNKYLQEFMAKYNKKFSKEPESEVNAHRPLGERNLEKILSFQEKRTLGVDMSFHYNNKVYALQGVKEVRRTRGKKVDIRTNRNGEMKVYLNGEEKGFVDIRELQKPLPVMTRKEVLGWKEKRSKKPGKYHPWRG